MGAKTVIGRRPKGTNRGITPKEFIERQKEKGTVRFSTSSFDISLARIILNPSHCQETSGVSHAKMVIDTREGKTIRFEILSNSIYLEVVPSPGLHLRLSDAPVNIQESSVPILTFTSQEEIRRTEYDIPGETVKVIWDDGYLLMSKSGAEVHHSRMTAKA